MLPRQHPPTSTPGPVDASSGEEICRNYIWGTCDKYEQCRYRHELDIERMKDIIKFCHDYQNRNGCTRQNCKFLHATKEEQNQFEAAGQIPRVLAERHAAITAGASNMQTNAETIPQIAMYISESYVSQPPPAPWPPLPPPPAVLPPVTTVPPPPPPSSPPRHAAQLAQQVPPAPASTTNAQLRLVPTTYPSVPQSQSVLFSMNQPPPLVPANFDATRPPPPIPSHIQPSNNGQLKRKIDANGNAGSSKTRKPEGPEVSQAHCESCMQRERRIERYKQQMEVLHNEEETQILLYKKNLQDYEIGRDILKIIVGPELFVVFNNLIEGTQTPELEDPGSSLMSGSPTVSKQDLLQFFHILFGRGTRNVMEPVPSTSHMDDTLQCLTSITRRHNVGSYSNAGPDFIKYVVDTLRNSSAPDRSPSGEERQTEPDMNRVNNRSNGYLVNGQKAQVSTSEPARYGAAGFSGQSAQSQEFGARAMPTMPNFSVAGPSGYAGPQTPAPPPTGYPVFHPAIPPPPNRYYAPTSAPGVPNMPYNGTERAPGPVPAQGMQPSGAPAALRPTTNAPNYNYMSRYPQPPYFPPYQ